MKKVVLSVLALALVWTVSVQANPIPMKRQRVRQCIVLKGMELIPGFVFVAKGKTRYLIQPGACLRSGSWSVAAVSRSLFNQKGLAGLDLTDPNHKWWIVRNYLVSDFVWVSSYQYIRSIYQPVEVVRHPDGRLTLRWLDRVFNYSAWPNRTGERR